MLCYDSGALQLIALWRMTKSLLKLAENHQYCHIRKLLVLPVSAMSHSAAAGSAADNDDALQALSLHSASLSRLSSAPCIFLVISIFSGHVKNFCDR